MAQVTDYDVANAAGSVVRAELNLILEAIKTTNAGTQNNLGTTSPCQLFADTTNNKLKIRSTSGNAAAASATFFEIGDLDTPNLGLLKATGGTMSGILKLDDSNSASTPVLSFDGDEDLGLFRKSANIMGFSSGGTEQLIFSADGITLRSQNEIRFGDSDSSNYIGIQAPATVASNKTITLPDETGTVITTASLVTQLGSQNLTNLRNLIPSANNTFDLGSTSSRWANLYVNDLDLSNEGKQNDVDMTWGSYTIQEGHKDLFLLNNRTGKKFKFVLQEVD